MNLHGWDLLTYLLTYSGDNDDVNLHKWRAETAETPFEKQAAGSMHIPEQEYFDNAVVMVAMVKAGVELAFEEMVKVGMKVTSPGPEPWVLRPCLL